MTTKDRTAKYTARQIELGRVKVHLWVPKALAATLKTIAAKMRAGKFAGT